VADYRVKLLNGTTTVDLYAGAIKLQEAGLSMPPPPVNPSYVSSSFFDGNFLTSHRYGNRSITLRLRATGSSLADLKTNLRTIQRLLDDARKYQVGMPKQGTLLNKGKLYLELQWGDTANQSTYFEIVHGEFVMPDGQYSTLLRAFNILGCQLRLECKPFGLYAIQTIAQATLENMDYAANHNYLDIVTAEAYGDVPALLYAKIAISGTNNDKKTWVAKRSGHRYDDDLWTEGEEETTFTAIYAGASITVSGSDQADAACSADNYHRTRLSLATDVYPTDQDVALIGYMIRRPPRGQFRVLIRAKVVDGGAGGDYSDMSFGLGYSYGSRTYAPTEAAGDFKQCAANNTYEILDLGIINIPPIAESDIAGNPTYQLRITSHIDTNVLSWGAADFDWCIDYFFLLPIDEGVIILDDTDSADVLALDGITDSPAVYKIDGSDNVSEYLDFVGNVFTIGRESTRIWVLRDDPPAGTFAVDIQYLPRFMGV